MSYTYLQEQGVESSVECFSDIPASVLSRLNLIADKSCCKDNETECCQGSQSGMTCEHSMESRGGVSLMSSVEGFLAKTYHQQTIPKEVLKNLAEKEADSGLKWPGWFAKLDQDLSFWKIRQLLLFEDLEESLQIWPHWGLMRGGECFQLAPLVLHTCENGCSALPTPLASDGMAWKKTGRQCQISLSKYFRNRKAKHTDRITYRFQWLSLSILQGATFTEMMMGFPKGWTDSKPLETAKFQQWLASHGLPFMPPPMIEAEGVTSARY